MKVLLSLSLAISLVFAFQTEGFSQTPIISNSNGVKKPNGQKSLPKAHNDAPKTKSDKKKSQKTGAKSKVPDANRKQKLGSKETSQTFKDKKVEVDILKSVPADRPKSNISPRSNLDPEKPMKGWYVGVDVGIAKYDIEGFAETIPPLTPTRRRTSFDVGATRPFVRGNIGYGKYWNDTFFTGVEFGYQKLIAPTKFTLNNSALNSEVKIKYTARWDGSILLGFKPSAKNLVYARLGIGITDVEVSPANGGAFHDLLGPVFGVGYSRQINSRFGFRVDVNYLPINMAYNNDKNDGENYNVHIRDTRTSFGFFYNF